MDWRDLQVALTLAQAQTLSEAARRLEMAPSSVSRRIEAFEQALGVELFERHRMGYRLTDAGRHILDAASGIEQAVALVQRRVEQQSMALQGHVTITAPELVTTYLCQALPRLYARYPQLRLSVLESHQLIDLDSGQAHVALRVTRAPSPGLWGRKIARIEFVIAGRRDIVAPLGAAALERGRWTVFSPELGKTPQALWEREHVRPDQVVLEVSSRQAQLDALMAGVGLGLIPALLMVDKPQLMAVGAPIEQLSMELWLLTSEPLRHSPRVRAVMDFVMEVVAGLALLQGDDEEERAL